jgi:hypothetical protein
MTAANTAPEYQFRLMIKIVASGNEVRDDNAAQAARER